MKILIESLGTLKKLRDEQVLKRLIKHLTTKNRRRESKGVIGFTKGLFSSLAGKKEETGPSEDERFNAITELTHIMANLCLPTEVTLPFLRNCLKDNEQSYLYLKDILLSKRDREQRQKLFSRSPH